MNSFYWHDYETWGANPGIDRPCQFAGVRTDADFNVIGEPLNILCQPPVDILPHPQACLVTGLTPQKALRDGLPECEFVRRVHRELSQPGTCGVGYNSIRFDDEVTRYALYRNFFDAYEREWKNGNSRWDLIDVTRLCYALRPNGIEWPEREPGIPSFRLEHLTAANGIGHESAHDALDDVYATIAWAKLLREKQGKLFDYALQQRSKQAAAKMLDVKSQTPVLHVSSMFPAAQGCLAVIAPLARHPRNQNSVICFDLSSDPSEMMTLSAEQIHHRVFTPTADLQAEGLERIPLKTVQTNKCPILATVRLLDVSAQQRLGIERKRCERHWQQLQQGGDLQQRLQAVYEMAEFEPINDPERALYSGGFFGDADRETMRRIRKTDAEQLAAFDWQFDDARLGELLFRYRARNYPHTLSETEQQRWRAFCYRRLHGEEDVGISFDSYFQQLDALALERPDAMPLLQSLFAYGQQLGSV